MQLQPPSVTPYAPQAPQSAELAQALASMRSQPQITTPQALGSNMVASGLNTFGRQGSGQAGAGQWTGVNGQPSGNWLDSPLGSQVGGLFGVGKAAQGAQMAQSIGNAAATPLPAGFGQPTSTF